MSGFIEGENCYQSTLFPERIDDYVDEDSVARVIDVFIDRLDVSGLGFKAEAAETGRPGFHPRTMLKIYVYGYLNQVHSSRRLEREAKRNVELMWLTGRLAPDHKTIANFRKDNGAAIKLVCREFVLLCRKLDLLSDTVSVDGSKFKAVNNRDKNFTKAKMKRRIAEVEASIEKYLARLERADAQAGPEDTRTLQEKISALEEEMDRLKKYEVRMLEAPDQQLSLTDPDARSMQSRGQGIVGYNVQTAVDVETHIIVAHEVNNTGSDCNQLHPMAIKAKEVLDTEHLDVLADSGYFKSEAVLACEEDQITTYLPRVYTATKRLKDKFKRDDFIYHKADDEYECPAGQRLKNHYTEDRDGHVIHRYWHNECEGCHLKPQCTTGKQRRVDRWEHEWVIDELDERMRNTPLAMTIRRSTVEHPFGTLKSWMGYTHFLTKTVPKVSTEMSLHVLAYNMKRVINLLGTDRLIEAMQSG